MWYTIKLPCHTKYNLQMQQQYLRLRGRGWLLGCISRILNNTSATHISLKHTRTNQCVGERARDKECLFVQVQTILVKCVRNNVIVSTSLLHFITLAHMSNCTVIDSIYERWKHGTECVPKTSPLNTELLPYIFDWFLHLQIILLIK